MTIEYLIGIAILLQASSGFAASLTGTVTTSDGLLFNLKLTAPELQAEYAIKGDYFNTVKFFEQIQDYGSIRVTRTINKETHELKNSLRIYDPKYREFKLLNAYNGGAMTNKSVAGKLADLNFSGAYQVFKDQAYNATLLLGLWVDGVRSSGTLTKITDGYVLISERGRFGDFKITPTTKQKTIVQETGGSSQLVRKNIAKAVTRVEQKNILSFNFDQLLVEGKMICKSLQTENSLFKRATPIRVSELENCALDLEISPKDSSSRITDKEIRGLLAYLQFFIPSLIPDYQQ